jgi:hypothetical protein
MWPYQKVCSDPHMPSRPCSISGATWLCTRLFSLTLDPIHRLPIPMYSQALHVIHTPLHALPPIKAWHGHTWQATLWPWMLSYLDSCCHLSFMTALRCWLPITESLWKRVVHHWLWGDTFISVERMQEDGRPWYFALITSIILCAMMGENPKRKGCWTWGKFQFWC